MGSLKHQILAVKSKIELVNDADLGVGGLFIRRMNGHQRDAYLEALYAASDEKEKGQGSVAFVKLQPLLLQLTLCDADGKSIFEKPEELGEIDGLVLDRLAKKAADINCFTAEAKDAVQKKV
jgi:hypothetical protein